MSELSGPLSDTFLEIYLDHHYRKAKRLQARARLVGISLDQLAVMARTDGVETIDFKLNLMEQEVAGKI
jgi:hypothetical protein